MSLKSFAKSCIQLGRNPNEEVQWQLKYRATSLVLCTSGGLPLSFRADFETRAGTPQYDPDKREPTVRGR